MLGSGRFALENSQVFFHRNIRYSIEQHLNSPLSVPVMSPKHELFCIPVRQRLYGFNHPPETDNDGASNQHH